MVISEGRLYWEQSGSGPDVVLIHGFSLDHRMWAPQVAQLGKHFRLTRYDVRGFGRSPDATGPHDPVADLAALLDDLGIAAAHVVGMSMGGAIAVDFALTYPDRALSLALIGANVSGFPHPGFASRFGPMFEAGRRGDLDGAKEIWLRDAFLTPVRDAPAIAEAVRTMVTDWSGAQLAGTGPMFVNASPPANDRLEAIGVPTLAIVGAADDPDMLAIADAVERRVPGARSLRVQDAGHLVNLELPAQVNRALLEFWGTSPGHAG